MPSWFDIAIVPVLIGLNAFFVAAEYAVVAITPAEIEALRRTRAARAATAMRSLKNAPGSTLAAIQICITMTNLLLGWIGEPAMSALLARIFRPLAEILHPVAFKILSVGLGFLLITLLTVVLSELLPKALTLRYTLKIASVTAIPVLAIRGAIRPLVWIMNVAANCILRPLGLGSVDQMEREFHTPEEIELIAAISYEQGALTARERSLIQNSLRLGRKTARDVMVPRPRVAHLDLKWSMEKNLEVIGQYLHSRLPLCDGGMDHIAGVIYTKDFLVAQQEADAADTSILQLLARPAVFVPVTLPLDKLLATFHSKQAGIVFPVDEYGGVEGIVTVKDVLDELVGELKEE